MIAFTYKMPPIETVAVIVVMIASTNMMNIFLSDTVFVSEYAVPSIGSAFSI